MNLYSNKDVILTIYFHIIDYLLYLYFLYFFLYLYINELNI